MADGGAVRGYGFKLLGLGVQLLHFARFALARATAVDLRCRVAHNFIV